MTADQIAKLHILVGDIRRRAKRKFLDAEHADDQPGVPARRALEHAAMCERNCAEELERIIAPADTALEE